MPPFIRAELGGQGAPQLPRGHGWEQGLQLLANQGQGPSFQQRGETVSSAHIYMASLLCLRLYVVSVRFMLQTKL